jgi:thiol:disulfide interchange protein
MEHSIIYYTGVAFLGGVILNVMPCVLPVLTMKVFHVIEKAKEDPSVNRKHGLAYSAGILAMFWVFAGIIITLRLVLGKNLQWGQQFQSPAFVAGMTALMVGFGLNALGVFEITIGMGEVEAGEGYGASFVNGIVASIMSTPCSAPFLGAAATFALGTGAVWWKTLLMFTFIGLGLAAPFLAISFVPAIGARLPRPGPWMETLKILMGFTLLGAGLWLFGTLQKQITSDGAQLFLGFLLVMSMAFWSIQHFGGFQHSSMRRWGVRILAVGATVGLGWWKLIDFTPVAKAASAVAVKSAPGSDKPGALNLGTIVKDDKIVWAPFSPEQVANELKRGRPVFMDYTAEWCANCKANEKLFIETAPIRSLLDTLKILPMKADYTNEDDEITKWMNKLGRSAIPIYVIYYPDGSNQLLPEVINTEMLAGALKKAAKKFPLSKYKPLDVAAADKPCKKAAAAPATDKVDAKTAKTKAD